MKKIIFLIFLIYSINARAEIHNREVVQQIVQIFVSAMETILENQSIINSVNADKSNLFGENFINQVKKTYTIKYKKSFPKLDNIAVHEMLHAMKTIMEANKALILDNKIKEKGFIPSIFAFQLSQQFSISRFPMKIKISGLKGKLFNKLNQPDQWEQAVLKNIGTSTWKNGEPHFEVIENEVRYMYPLYHGKNCLGCHGSLKDNYLNKNQPHSKWSTFNKSGFKMQDFKLNQLAGGISFTMDETIFKQYNSDPVVHIDNKVIMGVFNYPPFVEVLNNGEIKNSSSKKFTEVASFSDIELVVLPRKRLRRALDIGIIQLAFPVYSINELSPIGRAVTFEIPGLCFKKDNFLPFLSAIHLWKKLRIGYPGGIKLVNNLKKHNENPNSREIVGANLSSRLIKMLVKDRFDAVYVQNINQVYTIHSEYYDTIACSGFYGSLQPVYIAGLKSFIE